MRILRPGVIWGGTSCGTLRMKLHEKIISAAAVLVIVSGFHCAWSRGRADDSDLHSLYQQINLEYFGGRLPDADVEWGNLDSDYGEIRFNGPSITIILDPEENASESEVRMTLEHEMCHVQVFPDQTHGTEWRNCMERFGKVALESEP